MPEKKDNNNNLQHSHKFSNIVTSFKEDQETLFGDIKIKPEFKLNQNQFHLLSIFSLNPDAKLTRNSLFKLKSEQMHLNTISNFLKEAEGNLFIERCKVIPGTIINNLFMFQKMPDTFIDGSLCRDVRSTYFQITKLGLKVFEINEKINDTHTNTITNIKRLSK